MYFASKADSIVKQTLKQRQVHWYYTMVLYNYTMDETVTDTGQCTLQVKQTL